MKAFAYNAAHPEVKVMAMNPPAVPGLGSTGGFSLYIQNKKRGVRRKYARYY